MSPFKPERPEISILVLSWNTRALTLSCLDSLSRHSPRCPFEVLVVDNASEDGSADEIAIQRPEVRLIREDENTGYAAGNNKLARLARGDYLCLLNSDTEVRPGSLDSLRDFLAERPDYACAAPRLVGPDGTVQKACMRFPTIATALVYDMWYRRLPLLRRIEDRYYMRDFDHLHDQDVEQPPGTCLMIRRDVWRELGGMDERLWLFFNDVDLCRRVRDRGFRVRYLAGPEVLHHGGESTGLFGSMVEEWARNRLEYYRKHYGRPGHALLRIMIRLRAWQEWWSLGRRHHNPVHRRDARAELKRVVGKVLAGR
ncbi:MAG: glycosyltransferase family 2 protein [Planctomycetota bacterium]